ncbi:MAG: substrate-binding domain-containing protein [Bacteroidaceae bacterium]|nr:substrate-binding domain-containing protein [Bacteroidaceae bacterium]
MKKFFTNALCLVATLLGFTGCGSSTQSSNWLSEYEVKVAIDETFAPVMSEEASTYGLINVEATMLPYYVSEDSAMHLLVNDSLFLAIVTRPLNEKEENYIKGTGRSALQAKIATDAFALVVRAGSADTLFTLDDLRGIVTGKITRWEQLSHSHSTSELKLVFDNSGSSTVRFMRDSLCEGKPLAGNVFAQGSSEAVIEAVKNKKGIIGVVGVDWLRAKGDSTLKDFNSLDVTVARVSRYADERSNYCRPWQLYIARNDYPLTRSVYAICTDPRSKSLLKNFYFFLKGDRGQRIICNSQMVPNTPVYVYQVKLK